MNYGTGNETEPDPAHMLPTATQEALHPDAATLALQVHHGYTARMVRTPYPRLSIPKTSQTGHYRIEGLLMCPGRNALCGETRGHGHRHAAMHFVDLEPSTQ